MKFEIDNQTLKDLDIFDTFKKGKSLSTLFDFTLCRGGSSKLHSFLSSPSIYLEEINERKETIRFFHNYLPDGIDLDKNALNFAEYYFRHANFTPRTPSKLAFLNKIFEKINPSTKYYIIDKGVRSTVALLKNIHRFSQMLNERIAANNCPTLLQKNNEKVMKRFSLPEYEEVLRTTKISAYDTLRFDYMFRFTHRDDIVFFTNLIYEYDAYLSIAKAAKTYNLSYPEVLPENQKCFEAEGLFHPFVDNAISNDIRFGNEANLLFVSGPNMAGKSTFLKALGVAAYLAHVGFPVPARQMKMSLLSGICTTINIADNLHAGYSHFYAEVMRIKEVANELKTNKNMLVIFDELFRGTNVKDAYDGTLAIVTAFSKIKTSFFVISSHIVEVARELEKNDDLKFGYFEVVERNGEATYTYKLQEGISDVRLGMYIINREKLIEQINDLSKN